MKQHSDNQQLLFYLIISKHESSPILKAVVDKLYYGKSLPEIKKINTLIESFNVEIQQASKLLLLYTLFNTINTKSYFHSLCILYAKKHNIKEEIKQLLEELNSLLKDIGLPQLVANDAFLDNFNTYLNPSNGEFEFVSDVV